MFSYKNFNKNVVVKFVSFRLSHPVVLVSKCGAAAPRREEQFLKTHLPSPPPRARGARCSKDPCAGGGGASTAAPHDGGRAPTRVRPGATGPEAGLCPRRSGPLSLHLAHPCDMCARGRRPSDERRLIGRLVRRRVPKDLRSAGSGVIRVQENRSS